MFHTLQVSVAVSERKFNSTSMVSNVVFQNAAFEYSLVIQFLLMSLYEFQL